MVRLADPSPGPDEMASRQERPLPVPDLLGQVFMSHAEFPDTPDLPPTPAARAVHGVARAQRELELLGQAGEDPPFAAAIVDAVRAFAAYGHSGGSWGPGREMLYRLLGGETLTPLTSDPAEWEDRSEESGEPLWQNRRNGRAFSEDGGGTWWFVDGRNAGERCKLGGEWGVLERCAACGGEGLLHRPDVPAGDRFDRGGILPAGDTSVRNDTGAPIVAAGS